MRAHSAGLCPHRKELDTPETAVSIYLLDFYRHLFSTANLAIHAFVGALHGFHREHGSEVLTDQVSTLARYSAVSCSQGVPVDDPYRFPFGEAFFWCDQMHAQSDITRERLMDNYRMQALQMQHAQSINDTPYRTPTATEAGSNHASHQLRNACPACFGGSTWARTLMSGS